MIIVEFFARWMLQVLSNWLNTRGNRKWQHHAQALSLAACENPPNLKRAREELNRLAELTNNASFFQRRMSYDRELAELRSHVEYLERTYGNPTVVPQPEMEKPKGNESDNGKPKFYRTHVANNRWAYAKSVGATVTVLMGSVAQATPGSSFTDAQRKLQAQLVQRGTLQPDGNLLVFREGVDFLSMSGSASFVKGCSTNGWTAWQEIQASQVPA